MQVGLLDTFARPLRTRGWVAWALSAALLALYADLYFTAHLDVPARALGMPSRWTLYATVYTAAMSLGAVAALRRHRGNRHFQLRAVVNVGVQVVFAWALPWALAATGRPEVYLSYFWPLSWDRLFPGSLAAMPAAAAWWAGVGSLLALPWLARRYGKRVYCSWICGCGGLAETWGDPWRHLADPGVRAWRVERWSVHGVLVAVVIVTGLQHAAVWAPAPAVVAAADATRGAYGFAVGAVFSGVLGVALYPLMGTRFWCRFGCPMAALLGLAQKRGRFRVAVQPGACIACGNCSTYCEMGIDVRALAMRDQDVRRVACVGCGVCAHVCPRGVLRLTTDEGGGGAPAGWTLDLG
jgi:ferredoxin-type protein NapH